MNHESRIEALRARLSLEGVEALVVTKPANIRYLCGFTGSTGVLVVSTTGGTLFTDGRYEVQTQREVIGADVRIHQTLDGFFSDVNDEARGWSIRKAAFEAGHVTVAARSSSLEPPVGFDHIQKALEGVELVPAGGWVEQQREVKDDDEVASLRRAAAIADAAFTHILGRVEVGRTEMDLALDLEIFMRTEGAEGLSFSSIVASGENSALPHARASRAPIEKGRLLLFDFGCIFDGYCSDLTRTVVVGPAEDRHRQVYEVVAESQRAALAGLMPGVAGSEVDRLARDVITDAGWPEAFNHGLGHAVGLEVHEDVPRLSRASVDVVKPGHVVTVEPGAYFPGWGGVRIEDLVFITPTGVEVLSSATKELIVL